ncbi:hypothetical protein [Amycolatopsis sp. GA6-003]|uniref:hypothetical protein n=1 Tax=Amycolatopsis sp. GA6-003 TaxID=2652444 RepID=UPI003917534F
MPHRPMTPAEIYHAITGGQGPESLGETRHAAKELSKRLLERTDEIAVLAEKVRAGWHGVTAEQAANSAAPLMAASAAISTNLVFTQNAADGQLSAFQTVKNSVRPVGDRPELTAQDVYDVLNGQPGYFGKLDQWQADAQHNIDAYTGYHSTTGTNSDRIPARYAELSDTGASVDLASTSAPPKTVAGPGGPSGKPPDKHHPEPPPAAAGPVPEPRAPIPGATSASPAVHRGGHEPEPVGNLASARPPEAVAAQPESDAVTARPDSTRTSSAESSSPALPPGYQFGPSGQPVNPLVTGGFVPFGVPAPGNGGSTGGSPGGLGAGNRVDARTPGESAQTRGSAAGTPGAAGKNGSVLGGGIPGKSKEEDKERTAPPYLRESEDVFGGTDVKPTPPVLGDR